MKFYLFGHGSIGSRHQKNLIALGHQEVTDLNQAKCALICNPTSSHLSTALKTSNLPLFIEKPLSHNLDGVDQLTGKILHSPTINEIKTNIDAQAVIGFYSR